MVESNPKVIEIKLNKHYRFMYENFVLATQSAVYLLLAKSGDRVDVLKFDRHTIFRYGAPNDEVRGSHPLSKFGLGFYGLYQVSHSPWVQEIIAANRIHPRHSDQLFEGLSHFVACFKDVTFEIIAREMREVSMDFAEFNALVATQLNYLEEA